MIIKRLRRSQIVYLFLHFQLKRSRIEVGLLSNSNEIARIKILWEGSFEGLQAEIKCGLLTFVYEFASKSL